MAGNEVKLIVTAKSMIGRGLKNARAAIGSFVKGSIAAFKRMAMVSLATTAAIVGAGAKLVQAYSKQESAEKALIAARRAAGDAMADNIEYHKVLASRIQDETGAADESTLAMMAKMRTLGVNNDQMEEAIKLTMALEKVGMRGKTAVRAAADAIHGNTTALTSYIPALRGATTEAEKLAIVQDLARRGYDQEKEELNTVAGRWRELKGRIGDFQEVVGGVIANSGALAGVMGKVSEKIKLASESVSNWAQSGGFSRLVAQAKTFGAQASLEFTRIKEIGTASFKSVWIIAKASFQNIGIAAFNAAKITANAWKGTTDNVGFWLAKMWAKVRGEEWNIKPPKPPFDDIMKGTVDLKNAGSEVENLWLNAFDKINKKSNDTAQKTKAAWVQANEEIADAQEKLVKKQAEIAEAQQKDAGKQAAKAFEDEFNNFVGDRNKQLKQQADKDRKAELKDEIAKQQAIAKGGIKGFIQAEKEKQAAADKMQKNAERAKRLQEKMARGTKLSKKDQEFLRAQEAIKAAPKKIKDAQDALKKLEEKRHKELLDQQKEQNKNLKDIKKQQADLLAMG